MSINLKKRMTTGPTTAFVSCVNLPQQERDITMQEARMITGGNDPTTETYIRHGMNPPPTQKGGGIQPRGGGGGGGGRGTGLFRALFGGSGGSGGSEGSGGSGGESISELGFATTVQDNTRVGN